MVEYHTTKGKNGDDDDDGDDDDADNNTFDRLLAERIFNRSAVHVVREVATVCDTIVLPRTIADVQECLRRYNSQNNDKQQGRRRRQVSVRSGGHNWCGSSSRGAIMIDMRHFDTISIDAISATAVVGPAALGRTLNEQAALHQLCFPTGHCPTVPLGGYLLGGGHGWFQHAMGGMAAENIIALTIVTSHGTVLTDITESSHPDWLWLARGSAAAFPAVVVSFTLRLHRCKNIWRHQTNLVPANQYGDIVSQLCQMQLDGKLSSPRQLELSVIAVARTPSYWMDKFKKEAAGRWSDCHNNNNDEAVVVGIPDQQNLCLFKVYVMADTEAEFVELVRPLLEITRYCLYRSEFVDVTNLAALTDLVGPAYPPHRAWSVRSYQIDTRDYHTVDWQRLADVFFDGSSRSNDFLNASHLLTAIGPDRTKYASGGGAYGTYLPGLVVSVYGAAAATDDDDDDDISWRRCRDLVNTVAAAGLEESMVPTTTVRVRYNPLEHPVHRDTFDRCYGDRNHNDDTTTIERLRRLRNRFDPDHLFVDPSQIEPFDF